MAAVTIASFESKTRGSVEVRRGYDDETVKAIYEHSNDPGITKTLGDKDLNRFAPDKFSKWIKKNGGRFVYTAWNRGAYAAIFWLGLEDFPKEHFPKSPLRPAYTAAWRTGYSTPEGGTYEGEGIGKRIALAGIRDVVELTANDAWVVKDDDNQITFPALAEAGIWLETGIGNTDGQALYHHLGNTSRSEAPIGFRDVGVYIPRREEGKSALELEPRVGMVADSQAIKQLVAAAATLLDSK